MTKDEFANYISQAIRRSGSLPYKPPEKEIKRIIDLELDWLYREYRELLQDRIYILNKKIFRTKEFKNSRSVQMPECVVGIKKILEMGHGSRVFGINDPDLNFDRLMAADLYLTPLSSDQITYRTIQWSFWDLARTFNLVDINHDFNWNTKRLVITGRDPNESLMLLAMETIPNEDAYKDPLVQKWMIAKSKIAIADIMGMFDYNLIGNVKINFDRLQSQGEKEIEKLEEKIKGDDVADYFIMFH